MEVDFYGDLDPHGVTVFHGGLELPVLHGFDGLLIESHTKAAQHADVAGTAIGSDDQTESADSLVLRFASFFGEFRFGRVDLAWRGNTAADVEEASTSAAAFTGTEAWSLSRSHTSAAT